MTRAMDTTEIGETEQPGDLLHEPFTLAERPDPRAVEPDCPKCTGPRVRCAVGHVAIYGWWLERTLRPAGTLGPPRTVSSEVAALVCIRCGYTELYARDPAGLVERDEAN